MSTSVATNVMSINAQRNTMMNSASMATTLQRLSSGLRVNSAKDDAAGLAIASRMDTQVRGMNVAIRNANDGISLAQTAEAGLGNITDMLQRMRELAVQAANSTNTTGAGGDIDKLNDEYVQLGQEIQRNLQSVQFNGTTLLSGVTTNFTFQVGANSGTNQQITVSASDISIGTGAISSTFGTGAASSLNISAHGANALALWPVLFFFRADVRQVFSAAPCLERRAKFCKGAPAGRPSSLEGGLS